MATKTLAVKTAPRRSAPPPVTPGPTQAQESAPAPAQAPARAPFADPGPPPSQPSPPAGAQAPGITQLRQAVATRDAGMRERVLAVSTMHQPAEVSRYKAELLDWIERHEAYWAAWTGGAS